MRIGITLVPFVLHNLHYTLMVQTILSLFQLNTQHTLDLVGIVNKVRPDGPELGWLKKNLDVTEINDRNNLARAWNKGIKKCFERGADYVLVTNLDMVFHPLFLDNLVVFAEKNKDAIIWSGTEWKEQTTLLEAPLEEASQIMHGAHFHCFFIDERFLHVLGDFDEQFEPAYHEDSDMLYRMTLAGLLHKRTNTAKLWHFDRVTIKGAVDEKNDAFLDELRMYMDLSMVRYEAKWGGLPGQEKFKVPYNGQTK